MQSGEYQFFLKKFNKITKDCYKYCYLTRGKEFQEKALITLSELKKETITLKEDSITRKDENKSNNLLDMELVVESLINELKMWIFLKNKDPNRAWNFLIDAQKSAELALNSCGVSFILNSDPEVYINKLYSLEKLIFPPQNFVSPGLVIEEMECSICGKDPEDCEHIPGKPYMGKICTMIAKKISGRELSLLIEMEPDNKKARLATYEKNGVSRDVMTWRVIDSKEIDDI